MSDRVCPCRGSETKPASQKPRTFRSSCQLLLRSLAHSGPQAVDQQGSRGVGTHGGNRGWGPAEQSWGQHGEGMGPGSPAHAHSGMREGKLPGRTFQLLPRPPSLFSPVPMISCCTGAHFSAPTPRILQGSESKLEGPWSECAQVHFTRTTASLDISMHAHARTHTCTTHSHTEPSLAQRCQDQSASRAEVLPSTANSTQLYPGAVPLRPQGPGQGREKSSRSP